MNIVFPIGGQGERMKGQYCCPKACIPVGKTSLFMWVLHHVIPLMQSGDHIFVITLPSLQDYFDHVVLLSYPNITVLYLDTNSTLGAADTLTQVIHRILEIAPGRFSLPTMCMDCDTFYNAPVLDRDGKHVIIKRCSKKNFAQKIYE